MSQAHFRLLWESHSTDGVPCGSIKYDLSMDPGLRLRHVLTNTSQSEVRLDHCELPWTRLSWFASLTVLDAAMTIRRSFIPLATYVDKEEVIQPNATLSNDNELKAVFQGFDNAILLSDQIMVWRYSLQHDQHSHAFCGAALLVQVKGVI